MARAKKDQYCKDCKNSSKEFGSIKCEASHEPWVAGDTGKKHRGTAYSAWLCREDNTCDFQPKPPTVWERIKAVVIG